MATMKAIVNRFVRSPVLSNIPIPRPKPDEILVKVVYVSLNPTDYKLAQIALPPSKVIGCEFSGLVVEANESSFTKGDRVAGIIHGNKDPQNGGFVEYVAADPNLCFLVPPNIDLKDAPTLGVGWISALQALEQRLFKDEKVEEGDLQAGERKDAILIYSAATNVGMHALQFARVFHPNTYRIAIASSQHHERLKALGADACFDYKSPSLQKDVRELNKDILKVLDGHSEGSSLTECVRLMGRAGSEVPTGRIIRTLGTTFMKGEVPPGVEVDDFLAYTATGKPFRLLFKYYAANLEDYRIASESFKNLTKLLESGEVRPVRTRLMEGGIDTGIFDGFKEMKAGKVRGEKLVVKIAEESL